MKAKTEAVDIIAAFRAASDEIRSRDYRRQESGAEKLKELYVRFPLLPQLVDSEISAEKEKLIGPLLRITRSPSPFARSAALHCLGCLRAEACRTRAVQELRDSKDFVAADAAFALGEIGPAEIMDELIPLLNDPSLRVRTACVRAIEKQNYTPALPALLNMVDKARSVLQRNSGKRPINERYYLPALQAITTLQQDAAIPLLTDLALTAPSMRSLAVKQLSRLNSASVAPALCKLLTDPSASLRLEVVRFLVKWEYAAAIPFIRPLLNDPDANVRLAALAAIIEWKSIDCVDRVIDMAKSDSSPPIRVNAVYGVAAFLHERATDLFLDLVDDPNPNIQKAVAVSLGQLERHTIETVQALKQLSVRDFEHVRTAATEALARIPNQPEQDGYNHLVHDDRPLYLAVPPRVIPYIGSLIQELHEWQMELPTLSTDHSVEAIRDIDGAIALLLTKLKAAQSVLRRTDGDALVAQVQ